MAGPILVGNLLDQFVRDLLLDCLISQTKEYWLRRAENFEQARPRPRDFVGAATPQERLDQDSRHAGIAQACRNAAALCDDRDFRTHLAKLYDEVLG